MNGHDSKVIVLLILVLDLQLRDVPFVEYFVLDCLFQPARAFLHFYALLEQRGRFFKIALDLLS